MKDENWNAPECSSMMEPLGNVPGLTSRMAVGLGNGDYRGIPNFQLGLGGLTLCVWLMMATQGLNRGLALETPKDEC
jgi:hypothetical protein